MILSDDHSVPHVSCYGDVNAIRFNITPHLYAFAEQGMRFDRAYTSAPQCAPSRISIFAGQSPVGLGVTRFAQPARSDVLFFTDVLRASGYWVGLDGRHQHLDRSIRESEHIDQALRDAGKLVLPRDWPDLPEVRSDFARYLVSVRELDHGFGLIMQLLEQRGLHDDTLVIFMGDNGEALLRGKGTLLDRGTHVPLLVRWPGRVPAASHSDSLVCGTDLAPTILEACGLTQTPQMTGLSFLPQLRGKDHPGRKQVFAERGWHWGPITRTDGLDLSRSITTRRFRYIYNALPNRSYTPVDMPGKPAWKAIQAAHAAEKLSPLHRRLFFQQPRPIVELYDLESDPLELRNVAGQASLVETEQTLRERLESWMIREHDYLPLPSHAIQNAK
ncbi:MAG: sulfatase [Planctomycetota bacterium]